MIMGDEEEHIIEGIRGLYTLRTSREPEDDMEAYVEWLEETADTAMCRAQVAAITVQNLRNMLHGFSHHANDLFTVFDEQIKRTYDDSDLH